MAGVFIARELRLDCTATAARCVDVIVFGSKEDAESFFSGGERERETLEKYVYYRLFKRQRERRLLSAYI